MFGQKFFPYSTLQELNLDWILTKVKNILRFVPDDGVVGQILRRTADGAEWSNETGGGAVSSVNGQTGDVVLDASDVGALPDTYTAPVASVNGETGNVVLDASDVGALPDSYNPKVAVSLCETSGSASAKVASCYGFRYQRYTIFQITFTNTNSYSGALTLNINSTGAHSLWINGHPSSASNHTLPSGTYLCSIDGNGYYQIRNDGIAPLQAYGNYSASNPPPYPVRSVNGMTGNVVISTGGAVSSVNGQTGDVVLDASDVGALPDSYTAPVTSVNGQTGAVVIPTGGDIESGTNYCKLPDGTLMQWGTVSITAAATANGNATWTFPIEFIDAGYVVQTTAATGSVVNTRSMTMASGRNTDSVTIYWRNGSNSSYTMNVACFAIGRWKGVE